jgi:glycosyltransferase involved in cell wall biosynthesis
MIGAARYMKKQKIDFDIVHHVTFVNDWLPSFFSLLKTKNNKFIWGPIGSNDPISPIFLDGKKRLISEKVKIALRFLFRIIDPWFHYCKSKADCIVGINENVKNKLGLDHKKCFISEPGIALKKSDVDLIEEKIQDVDTFNVITVGRLVYIKNFKLTVLAFAKFVTNNPEATHAKLQIVGDGEDRKSLEALVQELNIQEQVEFVGKILLHEVQEQFENADLFLFPTLENAGFVILEAMSHSLPVLAMNYGGPAQFVIHNTKEQLVSSTQAYDDIVNALAANLEKLYKDETLRLAIGKQNRQDVLDHFTWEAKAQKMKESYSRMLNS